MLATELPWDDIMYLSRTEQVVAGSSGAALGMLACLSVSCTLIELSLSSFFGAYFGCLFCLIGGGMVYRSAQSVRMERMPPFAVLILTSGVMCFMLEDTWFRSLSMWTKLPVFSILGVSVCFSLLFSLLDVTNQCCGSDAIIDSELQMQLLAVSSSLLGCICGTFFGLLDLEDKPLHLLRDALFRDHLLTYPFGALIGAAAGLLNQAAASHYRKLPTGMFDDGFDDRL